MPLFVIPIIYERIASVVILVDFFFLVPISLIIVNQGLIAEVFFQVVTQFQFDLLGGKNLS